MKSLLLSSELEYRAADLWKEVNTASYPWMTQVYQFLVTK